MCSSDLVPWLMTLAFVAAFSLEAYSAIMLAAIVCAWVLNDPWRSPKIWRHQAFIVSSLLAFFCVVALIVTALYSQRPDSTGKFSVTKQIAAFFFANKSLSSDAKLYCSVLAVGLLAPLLVMAVLPFYRRLVQGNARKTGWISPVLQRLSLTRWMLFFLIEIGRAHV